MTTLLKFYANTQKGESNKLFSWRLKKPENLGICLQYWYSKGFRFKAAWLCKGFISVPVEIPEHMKVNPKKTPVQIKSVQIKIENWKPLFSIQKALTDSTYLNLWKLKRSY